MMRPIWKGRPMGGTEGAAYSEAQKLPREKALMQAALSLQFCLGITLAGGSINLTLIAQ